MGLTVSTPQAVVGTLAAPSFWDTSQTHRYNWGVAELAADRTIFLPLLTGNDEVVFKDFPQTLTQKTLTSATLNGGTIDTAAITGSTLTGCTYVSPTLSSPTLSGTVTFTGSSARNTGNARVQPFSDIANVQTTDATVTSLFTWTILDEAGTKVIAEVVGCRSTGAEVAGYARQALFKRDGGTVSLIGAVQDGFTGESVSTWDCTIDNSTSTGRVRVTGVAAVTIDWGGVINRIETNHA